MSERIDLDAAKEEAQFAAERGRAWLLVEPGALLALVEAVEAAREAVLLEFNPAWNDDHNELARVRNERLSAAVARFGADT